MIINIPLYIDLPRVTMKDNRIYLNLNIYRNLHYQLNNQAKAIFNTQLEEQILTLPKMDRIAISYKLYPKTKRLCDIENICCIVSKFFCDALVRFEVIPDDNYQHLLGVQYTFGQVDKENPRVVAKIHKH